MSDQSSRVRWAKMESCNSFFIWPEGADRRRNGRLIPHVITVQEISTRLPFLFPVHDREHHHLHVWTRPPTLQRACDQTSCLWRKKIKHWLVLWRLFTFTLIFRCVCLRLEQNNNQLYANIKPELIYYAKKCSYRNATLIEDQKS